MSELFGKIKEFAQCNGVNFSDDFAESIAMFQSEREQLYPEKWEKHKTTVNLRLQDELYKYFRNLNVANLPDEETCRGKQIGGFLFDSYDSRLLKKMIGFTPGTAFKTNNEIASDFDIDFTHLNKLCKKTSFETL